MPSTVHPPQYPRLKQLWAAGLSAVECGVELGIEGEPAEIREAVLRAIEDAARPVATSSLPDSVWTDDRIATMKRMRAEGFSAGQIADELGFGISRSAVLGKSARLGFPAPSRERSQPKTAGARSNLPARYRSREKVADPLFESDGIDGSPEEFDLAIPVEQRKTILQLTEKNCHWPIGFPGKPGFFFCGAESYMDNPYCIHHSRRAYQPPRQRTDIRRTA